MKESVFDPRTIGDSQMVVAYPELKRIREFDGFSDKKMRFFWYFACPQSPFFGETDAPTRAKKSLKAANLVLTGRELDQYQMCNFPEKEKLAIDRMGRFDIDVRLRMRDMINNILNNYDTFTKKMDYDNAEAYITAASKVIREIPNLLRLKEEGFAVVDDDKRKNASKGQDNISDFLKNADEDE